MRINPIIPKNFNEKQNNTKNNFKYNKSFNIYYNVYPSFTARVDKGMIRFYEVNADRMPVTVRSYIESLKEKFSISPLEAQKNAFAKLCDAKTIDDVKSLFPKENLFQNLFHMSDTKATNGLLGIYREFKEAYQSILKSGEDLSVYLLKKIFMESETIDEINLDLEQDLNNDIAQEFKIRHGDSNYILSSTLRALGITTPDIAYQNSLRFTREGYSDKFGLKISEGQLKYWNSLTEEQKFEILSKRLEGRDNWWNNLSYDEKLEYAAGIESEDELFNNYKKYVSLQKRRKTFGDVGEEGSNLNQVQLTRKKISVGSKLQHKDIFGLWMKKNLENFYSKLSEGDKDIVHMKRVHRLAVKWQTMSAEERTEHINKMKAGREPIRFVMIDAWNHSHNIIKELSKFLKEKQILKPFDLLYSSEEFSSFQSEIMTEFWETHPEFAVQLGENIKKGYERVQNSINMGQFQDLKQEILRDKAYRIKVINREYALEAEKAREAEIKKQQADVDYDYKKEFTDLYKETFYPDDIMPESFVKDITQNLINKNSKEWILKYIEYLKGNDYSKEFEKELEEDVTSVFDAERFRYTRAIENAIAEELSKRQITDLLGNPLFYKNNYLLYNNIVSTLQSLLIKNYQDNVANNIKKSNRIDLDRIEKLYNEYKKDIPIEELRNYVLNFFIPKSKNNTDIDKLTEYVEAYGKSISMLFSEQSAYSEDAKISLKNKFYKLMPEDLKEKYIFLLESDKQIKNEKYIKQIDSQLRQRFNFINKDFMKMYLKNLKCACRYFGNSKSEVAAVYNPETYLKFMGLNRQLIKEEAQNIPVPRHTMAKEDKYMLLAMEQAMADELFEASGDEKVYKLSFEAMCNLFEQTELLRRKPKAEPKLIINDMFNEIHSDELVLKNIPNRMNINQRYKEYCEDFDAVVQRVKAENREIDEEDLLCWLNPDEENELRDDIVMNRIKGYYTNI